MADPRSLPPNASLADVEAKRAARAAKKASIASNLQGSGLMGASERSTFLKRDFIEVGDNKESWSGRRRLRIMTWNMLAQCLVRRELFPGSDRLKWKDRKDLTDQIIAYSPDVACLQEVDRLEDHGPILERAGYDIHHVIGGYEEEGKQHGLAIIWKRNLLRLAADRTFRFDEATVGGRAGLSRATRNIALLVALEWTSDEPSSRPRGICVGTMHLFWHARYTYERARQAGLLVCEARAFRNEARFRGWPTFLAGDFNIQPSEAAYRFLIGAGLSPSQRSALQESRFVHCSVDKLNGVHRGDDAYVTMQGDEDRVFTNVRGAEDLDGLLDEDELRTLYGTQETGLTSLYGHWGRSMTGQEGNFFKDRPNAASDPPPSGSSDIGREALMREGFYEPMWTNFTPLWRCTLDYIFNLTDDDNSQPPVDVAALLPPHRGERLEPGLPRLGVEPSDHISLVADVIL